MSADLQRRLRWGLILLLLLAGCSTADKDAANFKQAQKLRQNAQLAARHGDTASALEDIDRVQLLEPITSRSPGLVPPPLSGPEHRTIRVYGEMVDLLWKDGLEAAAIRLETLWNQLADTHDFNLLCGYSMGNFYKRSALDQIKGQHTHLVADDGHASVLTNLHPSGAPH